MDADDWAVVRANLVLAGAVLVGFGISFAARPPAFSAAVALLGLVMVLALAPSRIWIRLTGLALLMAGVFGLLSIASEWGRALMNGEPQPRTSEAYLARGLVYAILFALGWAERSRRVRASGD